MAMVPGAGRVCPNRDAPQAWWVTSAPMAPNGAGERKAYGGTELA